MKKTASLFLSLLFLCNFLLQQAAFSSNRHSKIKSLFSKAIQAAEKNKSITNPSVESLEDDACDEKNGNFNNGGADESILLPSLQHYAILPKNFSDVVIYRQYQLNAYLQNHQQSILKPPKG